MKYMGAPRPCFDDWSITFRLTYNPSLISRAEIVRLIERAGKSVGLGEWRPGKDVRAGQFGRFTVSRVEMVKAGVVT